MEGRRAEECITDPRNTRMEAPFEGRQGPEGTVGLCERATVAKCQCRYVAATRWPVQPAGEALPHRTAPPRHTAAHSTTAHFLPFETLCGPDVVTRAPTQLNHPYETRLLCGCLHCRQTLMALRMTQAPACHVAMGQRRDAFNSAMNCKHTLQERD